MNLDDWGNWAALGAFVIVAGEAAYLLGRWAVRRRRARVTIEASIGGCTDLTVDVPSSGSVHTVLKIVIQNTRADHFNAVHYTLLFPAIARVKKLIDNRHAAGDDPLCSVDETPHEFGPAELTTASRLRGYVDIKGRNYATEMFFELALRDAGDYPFRLDLSSSELPNTRYRGVVKVELREEERRATTP